MKFLLTSCGISNDSIRNTLVDLLGKPIAESSALCIPTAVYAYPGGAAMAYQLIRGSSCIIFPQKRLRKSSSSETQEQAKRRAK